MLSDTPSDTPSDMPSDTPSETVCGNEGCGNEDYAREDYARGLSLGAPFPTNDLASWSMVRPLLSWTHLRGWQRAETWRRAAPRQVAPWAQWGKKNRRTGQCTKLPASSIGHT